MAYATDYPTIDKKVYKEDLHTLDMEVVGCKTGAGVQFLLRIPTDNPNIARLYRWFIQTEQRPHNTRASLLEISLQDADSFFSVLTHRKMERKEAIADVIEGEKKRQEELRERYENDKQDFAKRHGRK